MIMLIYAEAYVDADTFTDAVYEDVCKKLWSETSNLDLLPICTKFFDLAFNPSRPRYKIFLINREDYGYLVTGTEIDKG